MDSIEAKFSNRMRTAVPLPSSSYFSLVSTIIVLINDDDSDGDWMYMLLSLSLCTAHKNTRPISNFPHFQLQLIAYFPNEKCSLFIKRFRYGWCLAESQQSIAKKNIYSSYTSGACGCVRAQESNCVDVKCVWMPNNRALVLVNSVEECVSFIFMFQFSTIFFFIVSTVYVFCVLLLFLSLFWLSVSIWLWITIGFFGSLTPLFQCKYPCRWIHQRVWDSIYTRFLCVCFNKDMRSC